MTNSSIAVGGKAKNLAVLNSIPGISVPKFTVMPATSSLSECRSTVETFLHTNPDLKEVAVRSSAVSEDTAEASFAGMYTTKLRVMANIDAIMSAAEEVRQSGAQKERVTTHYSARRGLQSLDTGIAVIVQEMLRPEFSGVIFSHSLDSIDGYYLISTAQGLGEAVVSGSVNGQLIRVARGMDPERLQEPWLRKLITSMKTVEQHLGSGSLDVEFAYERGVLHILQCRPITTVPATLIDAGSERNLARQLEAMDAHVSTRFSGDVLGDMIDINPLELLGGNPSKLDISIFRHLFADTIVERARRKIGYDPLDVGLVREIGAKPYVSLRASAFSFRPEGIPSQTYEKMVSVYRDVLAGDPGLQSRVEFDVFAMRCGDKLDRIMDETSMPENEKAGVREAFRRLDVTITTVSETSRISFAERIAEYRERTRRMSASPLQDLLDHVAVGTELFVHIARLAFYWKNRFEEVYPGEDLNELLAGHIQSVSSRMQTDMSLCHKGQLARNEIVKRYGHLRPGQFSVFGESYADDPGHYLFDHLQNAHGQRIEKRKHRYENTTEFRNVVAFMQSREETKFSFSQSLGDFITGLKVALDACGIRHADASRCSWQELKTALDNRAPPALQQEDRLPMVLPEVIIPGLTNLGMIVSGTASPSYITRAVIKARVCVLDSPSSHADVAGSIVLIPNADPGYDFLFHSGATGIITKTGGPASHMCIRAVELQMPSCIGCGERTYNSLLAARSAVLDCRTGQIVVSE